jgi:hypothetical protein
MGRKRAPLFQEQQAFRQPRGWFLLAVLGWTIFMWLVYLRLITVRLGVKADSEELSIWMRGLWNVRKIAVGKIASVYVVTYKAAEDHGGYGIPSTGVSQAAGRKIP